MLPFCGKYKGIDLVSKIVWTDLF